MKIPFRPSVSSTSSYRHALLWSAALSYILIAYPATALSQGLDPLSAACVECHKGEADQAAGTVGHPGPTSHPVGMDYAASTARDRALTPPSDLDPRLALSAGVVACTTCHIPYREADHAGRAAGGDPMLVMDNEGSRLCLACHRK